MKKIPLSLKLAALSAALIQVGCATAPEPAIDVRTVNVAVPVPCREPVPDRPAWPMDGLKPGTSLNQFVSAALAERLIRDGYELQLETALRACTEPAPPLGLKTPPDYELRGTPAGETRARLSPTK